MPRACLAIYSAHTVTVSLSALRPRCGYSKWVAPPPSPPLTSRVRCAAHARHVQKSHPPAVARIVAETVQHFITAMDSLKLDMKVVYHIERIPH